MIYPTKTDITNAQSRLEVLLQDEISYNTEQFLLAVGEATVILDGVKSVSNSTVRNLVSNTEVAFSYGVQSFGNSTANLAIYLGETLDAVYEISSNIGAYANLSSINGYLDDIANTALNINESIELHIANIQTKTDTLSSTLASAVRVISALNSPIIVSGANTFPSGVSMIMDGIKSGDSAKTIGISIVGGRSTSALNSINSELYSSNNAMSSVSAAISTNIVPSLTALKLAVI